MLIVPPRNVLLTALTDSSISARWASRSRLTRRDGQREILGIDVFTSEDGAAWTSFLRGLAARGLSGVRLVISDDHLGLKQAIAAVLPGADRKSTRLNSSHGSISYAVFCLKK